MVCSVYVFNMASVNEPKDLTVREQLDLKNKRLVRKLLWLVVGSLLFAFALVPLYDVLCSMTGLNGKTQNLSLIHI